MSKYDGLTLTKTMDNPVLAHDYYCPICRTKAEGFYVVFCRDEEVEPGAWIEWLDIHMECAKCPEHMITVLSVTPEQERALYYQIISAL